MSEACLWFSVWISDWCCLLIPSSLLFNWLTCIVNVWVASLIFYSLMSFISEIAFSFKFSICWHSIVCLCCLSCIPLWRASASFFIFWCKARMVISRSSILSFYCCSKSVFCFSVNCLKALTSDCFVRWSVSHSAECSCCISSIFYSSFLICS